MCLGEIGLSAQEHMVREAYALEGRRKENDAEMSDGQHEAACRERWEATRVRQYRLALSQIRETIVCSHCGGEGHVRYGDPCQHCCGRGRVPRLSQEQMASVATRALTMDGGGS